MFESCRPDQSKARILQMQNAGFFYAPRSSRRAMAKAMAVDARGLFFSVPVLKTPNFGTRRAQHIAPCSNSTIYPFGGGCSS